ncbi:MAG: hypothetical protein ABIQ10_17350 [Gemmatimonadaceae bacterium]
MPTSKAATARVIAIISISAFLIGSAVWAGLNPDGVAGRAYDAAIPFAYGAVLLTFMSRAFASFRRRDFSGGVTVVAVTILVALALLPAIIGSRH